MSNEKIKIFFKNSVDKQKPEWYYRLNKTKEIQKTKYFLKKKVSEIKI